MAWTQVYDPVGGAVVSALLAGIPLISLFYMLAVRRAKGHYAAVLAVALSFILAVAVWGMPVGTALGAFTYGAAFGLFPIIWIVITAVWVYNMTVESGEFEYIKESLARLTDDRRLQAIFIAFAFGSFIEGSTKDLVTISKISRGFDLNLAAVASTDLEFLKSAIIDP